MMRFLSEKFGKKIQTNRVGFTLVEVLIAATIFTIVSLIGVTVFVNVIRIQRRVSLENAIYEDARVMMERIAREVRENTVDYEEYYNKASDFDSVAFGSLPGLDLYSSGDNHNPYGNRYGCYAKRFYNPGSDGPEYLKFGALCANGNKPSDDPGCIIDKTTLDINTGQNPYSGYRTDATGLPNAANAFCDQDQATRDTNCASTTTNYNEQNELYLINAQGSQKTILARKEINGSPSEHALAIIRLTGQDSDHDGVIETWRDTATNTACTAGTGNPFCCSTGFDCSGSISTDTLENTLVNNSNHYKGFVPLSPSRTDVTSLKFFIAPLEDPRKGFAETDPSLAVQQQPHVTIVLTVKPSASQSAGFASGDIPRVTIQTTVTSRVYNEVKSYYTKTSDFGNGVCQHYYP